MSDDLLDFNNDPPHLEPDPIQIGIFLDVVFGYCEGWIPLRGFIDHGQGFTGRPHISWIEIADGLPDKLMSFANWAAREGAAFYVIPGTVAAPGQAKAADLRQMQTVLVDLDTGDIGAKLAHLVHHLGQPTLVVASGGRTPEGEDKLHVWWRLTEPATAEDIARVCHLRGDLAAKVGGDPHFRSAHQPIRVAGSVHHKGGRQRRVTIRTHNPHVEVDLGDFAEAVAMMPSLAGLTPGPSAPPPRPGIDAVLTTPVRDGGQDDWTRFTGASAAVGHYIRLAHDGRLSREEAWEAICQYNAAMLRPAWPVERLAAEAQRLWQVHEERYGPGLERLPGGAAVAFPPAGGTVASGLPTFPLTVLLEDTDPMPDDVIGPRLLTPGGMLVVGGAPKVGKSDFLISLLVHMAGGVPFLGFTPPRPLRVFYLQAEIQYHYLRERFQRMTIDPAALPEAGDNLVATGRMRMLLDARGLELAASAVRQAFPVAPPDILCIDPIRNLFDGGPAGEGENDNAAMLFFLQERVEALRDAVAPDASLILCHHTRKTTKKQLAEDPFMALSGAGALRGFYTSGIVMLRPDEDRPERVLHFELRNGPALAPMIIDKIDGRWTEIDRNTERLVRRDIGQKLDAERTRKHDAIVQILLDEARQGRLYTALQFAETFENTAGLGSNTTIRDRISVLATKGYIKFVRDGSPFGLSKARSKFGYLAAEGMTITTKKEIIDANTGEISNEQLKVLPTHYKCPLSGAALPVENPDVWVYPQGEQT